MGYWVLEVKYVGQIYSFLEAESSAGSSTSIIGFCEKMTGCCSKILAC